MGNSGESLIDADTRIQELADEREATRRPRLLPQAPFDPVKGAQVTSLTLGLSELRRQLGATEHPVRKTQIAAAMVDLEERLAKLG